MALPSPGVRRTLSTFGRTHGRALRVLGIPALLAVAATAAAPSWLPLVRPADHTVVPGDTLWGLAQQNRTTVRALKQINHLMSDVIMVGQQLALPGNGGSDLSLAASTTPLAPTTTTYVVRSGDTLASIASRFSTTTTTLTTLNHLKNPNVVVLGARLTVPALASSGTTSGSGSDALSQAVTAAPDPRYASAITTSRTTLARRAIPSHSATIALVRAEAVRQGVPVRLALALATQESGLNQSMVSRTDAVGVMQLMPGTAAWVADYVLKAPVDRYDAASNIRAGVAYLRVLLRQTSEANAIAGYYQGLGDVLRRGMLPDTRIYVADVLALARQLS